MGAREKLNSLYFGIAAVVAGIFGLVTKSMVVFLISIAVLAGALFHDGSIRTKPRRRR